MINKEVRKSPSGIQTTVYSSGNCTLKFSGFKDTEINQGAVTHLTEKLYAPTAVVRKQKGEWAMLLSLPKLAIPPEHWERVKTVTEEILAFWEEVRGEL